MPPWVFYLIALIAVALAQVLLGSRKRMVLSLILAVVIAEVAHVIVSWSGSRASVVAAVVGLGVFLPWAAASTLFLWRPSKWHASAAAALSAGGYLSVLAIGLVVGDMTGWIPQ